MLLGSVLMLTVFYFPLWNIELGAPQYPNPLGMNIYINDIKGVQEFDLQNINGLNHYIGMKQIPNSHELWEFTVFPIVIAFMAIMGIAIAFAVHLNKLSYKSFLHWSILMVLLVALGVYDFYRWLSYYGENLSSEAILKLVDKHGVPMSYTPPLFGHKKLLNFDVYSYPHIGAYCLLIGITLILIAYIISYPQSKNMK